MELQSPISLRTAPLPCLTLPSKAAVADTVQRTCDTLPHCAHPEAVHVWVGILKLSISYPFFSLCVSEQNRVEDFAIKDAVDCRSMETRVVWKSISVDRCPCLWLCFSLLLCSRQQLYAVFLLIKVSKMYCWACFWIHDQAKGAQTLQDRRQAVTYHLLKHENWAFLFFCSNVKTILPRNL